MQKHSDEPITWEPSGNLISSGSSGWVGGRETYLCSRLLWPSFYHPQCSCCKVMFSHASVILFIGRCAWQGGHVWQGACILGQAWLGGGACVVGACMVLGHVWQRRGMHGTGGAWEGGMHGRRDGHYSGRYASYWNVRWGHGPLSSPGSTTGNSLLYRGLTLSKC